MTEAFALARSARALAREAAGDDIDSLGKSSNCSDIIEDAGVRPPSSEDGSPDCVDLGEPSVLDAGECEAVIE